MKNAGLKRRRILGASLVGGTAFLLSPWASATEKTHLPFAYGERELIAFPEKKPLIVLTSRPPQLETPFEYFDKDVITPNDAFFVRYHMSAIPTEINPANYKIKIGGNVSNPLEISLHDLKTKFTPKKIVAVNQCSGNSRGFFEPRVNGGQLGNGAMGNAEWLGVPLKDVLLRANPGVGARQVSFNGLDQPALPSESDFIKSFDIDHAMDGEVMLAYSMNGADIPMLNGYPVKLIVPGYFGTYWIKHISEINVINQEFNGFWMNPAYRIPDNDCSCVAAGTAPVKTIPINKFTVRSFITNLSNESVLRVNQRVHVRGIAFDSGTGIKRVLFSADGGQSWQGTTLGKDLGKFSFREWTTSFMPNQGGELRLLVRAFSNGGDIQPMAPSWNPGGYLRNVVETTIVKII